MGLDLSQSMRVERARWHFLQEGVLPGREIAPHISRSWSRCRGVDIPTQQAEPVSLADLSIRKESASWLLECAQPELDALSEHVVGQGCVVILSDAEGMILDEIGSPEFLPKAQRVALTPGVDWSEGCRGTNAIGTALAEKVPVMVMGSEHLLAANGALGCAAAPIMTAQGQLAGVLDISGESFRIDVHAMGLVRMAATQVEHRMLSQHAHGELVHFHRRPRLLHTPREGLLWVVDGRIQGLNRVATELLGMGWSHLLGVHIHEIFGARWPVLQRVPGLFTHRTSVQWAVSVERRSHSQYHSDPRISADQTKAPTSQRPAKPEPTELDRLLTKAVRVLDAGLPVLVRGETGSGKEIFSRRVHAASRRADGPLVAVNCAAFPDTLIEAELFGYEEGAFTGARRRGMQGRLREAHGGILFLDEIGDMPMPLQTRLLRVLEERRVRPLGSTQDFPLDFDLVCATHRDLAQLVREQRFREDLLYRLRGFEVTIPPLRERTDRRQLIGHLFEQARTNSPNVSMSDAALDVLDGHLWPGNVRELIGVLRSAVVLADPGTMLMPADFPLQTTSSRQQLPGRQRSTAKVEPLSAPEHPLAALTQHAIDQALANHRGNVGHAALSLGIHRSTLYRHLARRSASS